LRRRRRLRQRLASPRPSTSCKSVPPA
jgi:hypothetical protein